MQRPLIYGCVLVLVSCTGGGDGDAAPTGQATGEPSATAEPTADAAGELLT
jgi:hypothetical protein